jgi:hypothetical protein
MKLTNYFIEQIGQTIEALIEQNNIFGDKQPYTTLGYGITEYDNKFEIRFYIDYYENQDNQELWQKVTILKDETFRKLVKDVQDVIYAYNDVQGFEDEEDYNYHNNDKSEW